MEEDFEGLTGGESVERERARTNLSLLRDALLRALLSILNRVKPFYKFYINLIFFRYDCPSLSLVSMRHEHVVISRAGKT